MRILLHTLHYPPDVNSTGMLMEQVMESLATRGHEVRVITSLPHYDGFRVYPPYRGRMFVREKRGRIEARYLYVMAGGAKDNPIRRLASYLSFNSLATLVTTVGPRPEVVLATNGSFFSGLAAGLASRLRDTPFVFTIQDLYPDAPIRAGLIRNKLAIKALKAMERRMYALATRITVITPSFRDNLIAKGVPASKIDVVPNFVDTDFVRPLPKSNAFSKAHGLENKLVIAHAGNVGYVYDFDSMLDAAHALKDEPDIAFVIVGEGVAKSRVVARAQEMGLSNVLFLPYQPRETLPEMRASFDVQVSLYKHGSASTSMPSKLYEILASGRVILASAESESDVAHLVRETGGGLVVPPEDPSALVEAIRTLHRDPARRLAMGVQGREAAVKRYSREAAAIAYEQVLEKAIAERG